MNMSEEIEKKAVLGRLNYIIMAAGVIISIIGFVLMAGGGSEDPTQFNEEELFSHRRITLAPITVIFGYLVVIVAIMWRPKGKS